VPRLNAGYERLVTVTLGTGARKRELLGLRPENTIEGERPLGVRSEIAREGKLA
jgi:hypothetical protein